MYLIRGNMKVCIVGGGNAAHALAALLPYRGFSDCTWWCPYEDQARRVRDGLVEQGGKMKAAFAEHNVPSGLIQGSPTLVSKHAGDVVPNADLLILPLPSFAYPNVLEEMKPYLRKGQIVCVTPGQGGFDWFARDILGQDLCGDITLLGLMPLPFNCRITEYGKAVSVQAFKKKYSIGVSPIEDLDKCIQLVKDVLGASEVEPAGSGSFLECTMFPINAVIHPARLSTLLKDWRPGQTLKSNPLFYEEFTNEAAHVMNDINAELIAVGDAPTRQGVDAKIPHIFDWLAGYVYDEPPDSDLQRFFSTNDAYKGFRCPLVPSTEGGEEDGGGYVPDFTNRYFTEDINLGLCGYKGLSDIAGVETPVITGIIRWAQRHMGREFVVDDDADPDAADSDQASDHEGTGGRLSGRDVGITNAPQRFGIRTIDDLRKLYPRKR